MIVFPNNPHPPLPPMELCGFGKCGENPSGDELSKTEKSCCDVMQLIVYIINYSLKKIEISVNPSNRKPGVSIGNDRGSG